MAAKLKIKDIEEAIRGLEVDAALERLYSIEKDYGLSLGKLIEKLMKKKAAEEKEKARLYEMSSYEREARSRGYRLIAGIDEAGRGPLAGPVVAAAVILPESIVIKKLNDSKKLTPAQRDILFDEIKEKAVAYGIGIEDESCIDEINILNATKRAMITAFQSLDPAPDFLLMDAVHLDAVKVEQLPLIKGDSISVSIAAASILAKVTRDRMLDEFDQKYPEYGFCKHKGYGTLEHIEAIKKYGICPIHRVSFTKKFVV